MEIWLGTWYRLENHFCKMGEKCPGDTAAVPGILSGIILAIGRIVGETAALLYTSGTATRGLTKGLMSSGRTLAVHMYTISSEGFHTKQTFATAVILLVFVFIINTLSSVAAKQISKKAGGQ